MSALILELDGTVLKLRGSYPINMESVLTISRTAR